MDNKTLFKEAVIDLFLKYFGSKTADMYCEFFNDKSSLVVVQTAREVLKEVIGETETEEQLRSLCDQFKINVLNE